MSTRAAIVELLHADLSNQAIARQVHVRVARVQEVREALGVPSRPPGPRPSTPVDLFWRRAQITDDGHMHWPGASEQIRNGQHKIRVRRVAFIIRWHREPAGPVTASCDFDGCVHPDHVEDQPMRDQYTAIFGEEAA